MFADYLFMKIFLNECVYMIREFGIKNIHKNW